ALHLVAIMADEVDRLLDLADRFEARLADLDQAGDRNVPLALVDDVRAGAKDFDAPGPAEVAPRGISCLRGGDRLVHQCWVGLRKLAEDDGAIDRAVGDPHFAFGPIASANQRRAALAEEPRLG